jgi:hypothetical protein
VGTRYQPTLLLSPALLLAGRRGGRGDLVQAGLAAGEETATRLGKRPWEVERIEPDLPFPKAESRIEGYL